MKTNTILLSLIFFMMSTFTALTQSTNSIHEQSIGIVISSNDPETDWNAFRLANYAVQQGDWLLKLFVYSFEGVSRKVLNLQQIEIQQAQSPF